MASTSRRKPRATQWDETHRRFLEEGMRRLVAEPSGDVTAGIRVMDLAYETGMSTGAFYSHWASLEDYQRELLLFALHPERGERLQRATLVAVQQEIEAGMPFDEAVRVAAKQNFGELLRSDWFTIVMAVWPQARVDDELRERIAAPYRMANEEYALAYAEILEHYDLEFVDPGMTTYRMAVALNSIVEGFAIRAAVDPDSVGLDEDGTSDELADVLVAYLRGTTRAKSGSA